MGQEHTHVDSPQIQSCNAQQASWAKNYTEVSTFAALCTSTGFQLGRCVTLQPCQGAPASRNLPLGFLRMLTPCEQWRACSDAVRIITYILVKERNNLIWMQDRTFCHTCTIPAFAFPNTIFLLWLLGRWRFTRQAMPWVEKINKNGIACLPALMQTPIQPLFCFGVRPVLPLALTCLLFSLAIRQSSGHSQPICSAQEKQSKRVRRSKSV